MLRVTVLERGRVVRGESDSPSESARSVPHYRVLPSRLYDRLERSEVSYDERDGKGRVIDWHRRHGIVGQWVGVIQIPGLQLEILPKTDDASPEAGDGYVDATRRNLITMLVRGGLATVRSRGVADLSLKRATLHDRLVDAFLDRTLEELERGLDRHYATEEGNLPVLRGKLVIAQQITRNAAQRHRFYCRHDALTEATPISIRLKQCCRVLVERRLPESVLTKVRDVLSILEDVPDVPFRRGESDPVFNRQNERFEDIYSFACMVLEGQAADVRRGRVETFTLLFDMDKVFERFIAAFLQAEVMPQLPEAVLRAQGAGHRRYLFAPRLLHMKPDLLVEQGDKRLVIDTKWKRLGEKTRPANADLYQLYAYVHRYECQHAYLLYPQPGQLKECSFDVLKGKHDTDGRKVGIRFASIRGKLWTAQGKADLAKELTDIIREGLGLAEPVEATA